jgi:Zn-dependent M28 family amino/carboxypeptidase
VNGIDAFAKATATMLLAVALPGVAGASGAGQGSPSSPDGLDAMTARLRRHVEALAKEIGERNVLRPAALRAAAEYIRSQWRDQGYEIALQRYEAGGVTGENLEVTVRGRSKATEIVLVGAHYDTVRGSPGANDNASGVAALLEISREFASLAPERTVRFVAFVNEEPPFFASDLMGSAVYAKAARARGDDIRLMVSLEMLGFYSDRPGSQSYPPLLGLFYPDRANFVAMVSNFRSRPALLELVRAFRGGSDFPVESLAAFEFVPGVAWSDQLSFWRQGYPAVMVTDTAFYRYSHYHSASDTPEKLVYPSMARVVAGLRNATAGVAR